jgi:hypothetical protein
MIRGLHPQPHAEHCRRRIEKALGDDARLINAKARVEEKGRRIRREEQFQGGSEKRRKTLGNENAAMTEEDPIKLAELFENYRKEYETLEAEKVLEDIEEKAMEEEDPVKLAELFERYREEYMKKRGEREDSEAKRRKAGEDGKNREVRIEEMASASNAAARYEEMHVDRVVAKEWEDHEKELETWAEEYAWDDVNGGELPLDKVRAARQEEMNHMKGHTFVVVKKAEAYRVTGRGPISTKWVDTDKSHGEGEMLVRSRFVARDFKGKGEKDREDLFSATPPLELIRYALSRQATKRPDGRERKSMYIDIKKAHLIPKCKADVYIELPPEAGVAGDECGRLSVCSMAVVPPRRPGKSITRRLWPPWASRSWSRVQWRSSMWSGTCCALSTGTTCGRDRRGVVFHLGSAPELLRDQEPWAAGQRRERSEGDRHAGPQAKVARVGSDLGWGPAPQEDAHGPLRDGR